MNLLLDTHVMLGVVEPDIYRLPSTIGNLLAKDDHLYFVSVASLWEISIKNRLGKLPLDCPLAAWPSLLATLGVSLIDISVEHVLADLDPTPDTKDPFDRLILSTAMIENMRLVTVDRALSAHPLAWRA